jgi:hypothetical protein
VAGSGVAQVQAGDASCWDVIVRNFGTPLDGFFGRNTSHLLLQQDVLVIPQVGGLHSLIRTALGQRTECLVPAVQDAYALALKAHRLASLQLQITNRHLCENCRVPHAALRDGIV